MKNVAVSTFCEMRSASIQELVHQIGVEVLERFPEIAAVDFYVTGGRLSSYCKDCQRQASRLAYRRRRQDPTATCRPATS